MEKRYIKIGHELVAVNEEVYKEYTRWKENLRYRARRDGKCGQPDYSRCSGDVEVQYIGNSKGRKENPTVVR